jgi:hypothetical protein
MTITSGQKLRHSSQSLGYLTLPDRRLELIDRKRPPRFRRALMSSRRRPDPAVIPTDPSTVRQEPSAGAAALVQCAGCGIVADRAAPPGWLIARGSVSRRTAHAIGVCPVCQADRYTFYCTDAAGR